MEHGGNPAKTDLEHDNTSDFTKNDICDARAFNAAANLSDPLLMMVPRRDGVQPQPFPKTIQELMDLKLEVASSLLAEYKISSAGMSREKAINRLARHIGVKPPY
ncbi:hypothetical protein RhiJN_11150 [Ceratobasidium sp. AG-Ba]|nr:hypothetical protein RhiJN_11150 [Ceratobasidium sp. AG-Ba]QRW11855.1 hypothetical protein RhiLY_10854 [Ceratobasidium sp. AG-Ba]